MLCCKINSTPVSHNSHILQPEITLIEEKREMYSIIESMENQIRKHKKLKNSMNLSLDSKKVTPWSIMHEGLRPGMEILDGRLNRRWRVCLLSLPLSYPRPLLSWFSEIGQLIDVPWPLKKYRLQLHRKCWAQVCDKIWLLFFAQSENGTSHKRPRAVAVGKRLLLYSPSTHIFWTHQAYSFLCGFIYTILSI